ncbi:hypothetical protein FHW17_004258 [Phyllobacterium sp. P30BS-XVII]|nr:hypothetical protein [Phyllobacterium sp. P30BS-XVII]
MQFVIKCLIGAAIFAAPCAYDTTSSEPSAVAGLVALVSKNKRAPVPVERRLSIPGKSAGATETLNQE